MEVNPNFYDDMPKPNATLSPIGRFAAAILTYPVSSTEDKIFHRYAEFYSEYLLWMRRSWSRLIE